MMYGFIVVAWLVSSHVDRPLIPFATMEACIVAQAALKYRSIWGKSYCVYTGKHK